MEEIANYDFDSQLNESILGHIFEQSVSDIEELKKTVSGEEFDKKESKRKKDGIYYTPKYITKYIVEETLNSWIEDKRKELGEETLPELTEKDYKYDIFKKNYSKNFRKHIEFWEKFREALRKIKIVDPACGSGAFLIEAFDFLLKYNQMVNKKIVDLTGVNELFSDTTKEILENNIFGVDLNKESIEITKLSLWLRTADKNKTLATLENNIKCGNSLISDKELDKKAFDWKEEFKEIFEDGGFDIVVGNPPYVLMQPSNTEEKLLEYYKNFEVASYKIDLFHLFFEKGIKILKNNGKLGFITPNTYLTNKYIQKLREFILKNCSINEVINYKNQVFSEANVDVAIIILSKNKTIDNRIDIYEGEFEKLIFIKNQIQKDWEKDEENIFNMKQSLNIKFNNCLEFEKIGISYFGIQAFDKKSSTSNEKINENYMPLIDGREVNRYEYSIPQKYFDGKQLFPKIKGFQLKKLPIKNISLEEQAPFIEKADTMLKLNKELQNKIKKFKNRIMENFELKEISKKMENFYDLSFKDFVKELSKQKIKLKLQEQDEWEEYFLEYKNNIIKIKQEIDKTDSEINNMIYKLYDLTDEEIKIIEENA